MIVEECRVAGVSAHVADPAEASTQIHGVKRRAKTDKVDTRRLRMLGEPHPARHRTLVSERCATHGYGHLHENRL